MSCATPLRLSGSDHRCGVLRVARQHSDQDKDDARGLAIDGGRVGYPAICTRPMKLIGPSPASCRMQPGCHQEANGKANGKLMAKLSEISDLIGKLLAKLMASACH